MSWPMVRHSSTSQLRSVRSTSAPASPRPDWRSGSGQGRAREQQGGKGERQRACMSPAATAAKALGRQAPGGARCERCSGHWHASKASSRTAPRMHSSGANTQDTWPAGVAAHTCRAARKSSLLSFQSTPAVCATTVAARGLPVGPSRGHVAAAAAGAVSACEAGPPRSHGCHIAARTHARTLTAAADTSTAECSGRHAMHRHGHSTTRAGRTVQQRQLSKARVRCARVAAAACAQRRRHVCVHQLSPLRLHAAQQAHAAALRRARRLVCRTLLAVCWAKC